MGVILQSPEILRRYAWEDLEVDRENPMSNGLLMFVVPATEGSGARDIARPWVGRFLTSQLSSSGIEGDALIASGSGGAGDFPALAASITLRSCLYFGSYNGNTGGNRVFIGGGDGGSQISFGMGNGFWGGLYGGAFWTNSGLSLSGRGTTAASSIGWASDAGGDMKAVCDGDFLGTYNLGGAGGATTTFGLNQNGGGGNSTAISNTLFRAMLLWRGAVSVPTMQTLHRNPYALLRLKQARRTHFVAPAGTTLTSAATSSGTSTTSSTAALTAASTAEASGTATTGTTAALTAGSAATATCTATCSGSGAVTAGSIATLSSGSSTTATAALDIGSGAAATCAATTTATGEITGGGGTTLTSAATSDGVATCSATSSVTLAAAAVSVCNSLTTASGAIVLVSMATAAGVSVTVGAGSIGAPEDARPIVIHTFPMTIANAVNTARVTSPVHRARLTKPHALSIE